MTIRTPGADFTGREAWGFSGEQPIREQDSKSSPIYSFSAVEADGMPSWDASPSNDSEYDHPSEEVLSSEHTGPISVAELTEYLSQFADYFKRSEGRRSLERHLTGLLIAIGRKNAEQIAQAVANTNSQRLQALLTELRWDANAVNRHRVQQLVREATTRGGILVCGETEMQKQGGASVGVARQYVDSLDKVKNCQLVIAWQYVDADYSWPVNARLYLPREWTQEPARCQRARIPEEARSFLTKPEIALALLDEATQWGTPYRSIATTAAYGSDALFLEGLERRKTEYLVAVPEEFSVQVARRKDPSGESAKDIISRLADDTWQPIAWPRSLSYGGRSLWTRVLGWRTTPAGQGTFGWLIAERPLSDTREFIRYYFTNTHPQASLNTFARMARRASRLEEFARFAKSELGWNQYEGRLWPGFHRHALLIFLAYSFLTLRKH
ncbi:MAG: IS701 family transposase [Deltaproteobacteria bacterium]|nr:IS701 family transposase [Deltaproteobacteria bacterium]